MPFSQPMAHFHATTAAAPLFKSATRAFLFQAFVSEPKPASAHALDQMDTTAGHD